jgi:DHA2 family multidrug resistance protein-like MFS transporter
MTDWTGLPAPRRYWSVAAIWLAIVMSVLDASIANVALPTIAKDLRAAGSDAIWVVNAYQLAIVVSLLPLAALGEIVTYRRVFLSNVVLFTLASLACAFARTLPELAIARAVQGLGAAGVMSVNGALLRFTFPNALLGRAVGLNALVVSVAAVVGPSVASAILALASWPWLFAVNLPVGLAAALIGRFALPDSAKAGRALDWVSAGLNVMAFGLTISGVDLATRGGSLWIGVGEILAGVAAGALLVRRSLGQPQPLAPVDLMKSPLFSLTVLTSIASFAAQMLAFVALPFLFQDAMHRSQVETGLLMTPWPVAVGFAAPLAGRLSDRYPAAMLSFIGLSVMAVGLVLLASLPARASSLAIGLRMATCGLGFGFFQAPNNRTMLSSVPMARSGAAGGMLATARLTGQTVGATLAAILFHQGAEGPVLALWGGSIFAGLAALVSVSRLTAPAARQDRAAQV